MSEHPTEPSAQEIAQCTQDAVFVKSEKIPEDTPVVKGEDFSHGARLDDMVKKMLTTGFQATNVALAIEVINKMISWRLSDEPVTDDEREDRRDEKVRKETKCTIYLSYTSNMISSGIRETICFLVKHKLVDVIVTTGGGIEEDLMKCLAPTYVGDFRLNGQVLRKKGLNRIGNLLVPNDNYCLFDDFIGPILHEVTDEQVKLGTRWTPSRLINRFGKEINHPDSVYYWCYKNDIPVFCPAITDGSIGDMIYFHSYKRPEFTLDLVDDIRAINDTAVRAARTGMIILGGGLVKHHTCNANLMRNGADYAVYINTGQEFDGSDSGATPDEAVSWGKIKSAAEPVKIYSEATLVFPMIVSQTFLKAYEQSAK